MLHILHVIESLEFGGAEKVVVHLANQLANTYKVSICLTKYSGELVTQLDDKIAIYSFEHGEGNDFRTPKKLAQIVADNRVDIIHTHNWSAYLEAAIAVFLARRASIIHTVHGPYTEYGKSVSQKLKKSIRHRLERYISQTRCLFRIVTVSDSVQDYIIGDIRIAADKLTTIRNGITPLDYHNGKPPPVDPNLIKLVTVGRLAKIKNHKLLLDAFKLSLSENKNIHLTLIGDGPERGELERHAENLGISKQVIFSGFVTDVQQVLPEYDIFILSSDYEGISIALLEAMSAAMPSIATDVGGITETITNEDTGLVVPKQDPVALAGGIGRLATSSALRERLGNSAKRCFDCTFHENIVLEKYQGLYQECSREQK